MRRALALTLAALLHASAAWAASGPEDAVRATLRDAKKAERMDAARDVRLAALRAAARELVDTRTMGRIAIGPALDAQTPAAQEEFFRHFDVLVVRSWMQKLLFFRDPQFAFAPSETHADHVLVKTRIVTPKDYYLVNYEMRQRAERWWATDIVVEGMSITQSYRAQFEGLLARRSFDEVLELLRRKTRTLRERDAR